MMHRTFHSAAVLFPLTLTLACTTSPRSFTDVDASPATNDAGEGPSSPDSGVVVGPDAATDTDQATAVLTVNISSATNTIPDAAATSDHASDTSTSGLDAATPNGSETITPSTSDTTGDVSSSVSSSISSTGYTASDTSSSVDSSEGTTSCDGQPTVELACGDDGNVHVVDTCGDLGDVSQVCSGECREGACRCVVYVNSGGSDDNDGTSWAGAKQSIGNAIATAQPLGCEVWVRTGTYRPGYSRTHSIQLVSNVAVFGGFSGTENFRDERNFNAYPTILTGDVAFTPADTADDAYHIVLGADGAILDGFTISGANTEGAPDDCGGGVLNNSVSPILRNLNFSENLTPSTGADICNRTASPVIEGCNFTNSRGTSSGGGFGISMYQQGGSAILRRSVFIAIDGGRGSAAGILNEGQLLIEDSEFRSLNIRDGGSAIYNNTGATLTIKGTLFMDNSVNSSGSGASDGGAIYSNGTLKVVDSTFANNRGGAGGAIGVSAGSVTIVNSRFVGNSAGIGYGGAITVRAGALNVANTLFESNTANAYAGSSGSGGAIYMGGGGVNVVNSTFVGNTAALDQNTYTGGGALYLGANSINDVANCLFWGNTGPYADDIQLEVDAVLQLTSSTFGAGYPCYPDAGCTTVDPEFDPALTAYHDYTPASTSGCVDSGSGGELPADTFDIDGDNDTQESLPLDLLSRPRVAGMGIDVGAFESQP